MNPDNNLWQGHKVRLRALTVDDWQAFHADGQDTETARHGDDIKLPSNPDALKERLEKQSKRTGPNCWLGVESIETDQLVGSLTIHGADERHRNFEYGIAIFRDCQRSGYASEAVALALRYYFRELGFRRAMATVYQFNKPSMSLHKRMGFKEEGLMRDSLFTHGKFHSEYIYSMLSDEFADLESRLPPVAFRD